MLYITSDWHLGCPDTRLEFLRRPFSTSRQNLDRILSEHNQRVLPDDHVIIVGDVVDKNCEDPHKWLKLVNQFHGKKTLIRGNHDDVFSNQDLKPYFQNIIADGAGMELEFQPEDTLNSLPSGLPKFYVTHYPTRNKSSHFNLVGHIHGAWAFQKNMINVGVDANHFRPWNVAQILFTYNAICNVYDRDVWASEDPGNQMYSYRGSKTSYADNLK